VIVGGKITAVEGKKMKEENPKGLSINISLTDVKTKEDTVEVEYVYTASYPEGVGELIIKGIMYAKEDKKLVKKIEDEWKKSKKVPEEYAELLLSAINYSGSANGTLLARVLNMSPPLFPPKLSLKK